MKKRNKFSLTHYRLFSGSMGNLIPIGLTEVLPGDTIQHRTSLFIRLAPMVTPVMHPVHAIIHHWYVPARLLWSNFESFITGGADGMDASVMPTITAPSSGGFAVGSLADYLGIPTGIPSLEVSALPFRAYDLIWNECYRDQDLQDPLAISLDDGADTTTATSLQRCAWGRDYFTTSRPWPQKGPAVSVPVNLAQAGQPSITATTTLKPSGVPTFTAKGYVSGSPGPAGMLHAPNNTSGAIDINFVSTQAGTGLQFKNPGLTATTDIQYTSGNPDLGSVDINQLREAFALQRFEEHRALYGSRYVEYLRYLGVRSSDARLQRPEYLGGSRQTIQFSEVLQTGAGETPIGSLYGHGIGAMRSNRYRRFIEEHGYIISLAMVLPISVYMQGLPRLWNRRVKEDYFQPELQHIGQQEVLTKELYAGSSTAATEDSEVFGYQNRYDEYRAHESYVSGEFRTVLDSWHMARNFANEPALNADFISAVPTMRIFAAQQNDTLYCMAHHSIQARRLLSKYGNPI